MFFSTARSILWLSPKYTTILNLASRRVFSSHHKRKMSEKLVWVDCEMTGLNVNKDTLLEVAIIITDTDLKQLDTLDSIYIGTSREKLDTMNEWCKTHFAANGLTELCLNSSLSIEDADEKMHQFMLKNNIKNGFLAGNSIGFDRVFLDKYCPKFTSHLHYRTVDVSSIKVLVSSWYKDFSYYNKPTQHRALSDIEQSIQELKYYKEKYFKNL